LKGEGMGVSFKGTKVDVEIKSRLVWGEAVLTAIKFSTSHNLSVVRWDAQMRGGVEQ